jgi:RNA polymerase sigma-32 factor
MNHFGRTSVLNPEDTPHSAPEILLSEEDEPITDFSLSSQEAEAMVLDVTTDALVKRESVTLGEHAGEWLPKEAPAPEPESPAEIGDLYRTFIREATRYERLTEDEERAYGLKVRDHQDRDAARKLVVHNLRLVIKMAHQYRRSWSNIMDLIQEGSAGMATAAERWDPDKGTRFGTYAAYWIRAMLTKFLMTNGRVIHTGNTRAGRKLYFKLPVIRRRLLAEGKAPSVENIAREVEEDEEEVALVLNRLEGREASLSAPIGDGESGHSLGDTLKTDVDTPEGFTAHNQIADTMTQLVVGFGETLSDERDLVIWKEHLVHHDPKSLVELGKRYGVSKQRMGQLATRLKKRFRCHVIDELGPHTELSWLFDQK